MAPAGAGGGAGGAWSALSPTVIPVCLSLLLFLAFHSHLNNQMTNVCGKPTSPNTLPTLLPLPGRLSSLSSAETHLRDPARGPALPRSLSCWACSRRPSLPLTSASHAWSSPSARAPQPSSLLSTPVRAPVLLASSLLLPCSACLCLAPANPFSTAVFTLKDNVLASCNCADIPTTANTY